MKAAGSDRRVKRIGKELSDGVVYTTVINHIKSSAISMDNLNTDDNHERADGIIDSSEHLVFIAFIKGKDIVSGNDKLNTLYCCQIFNSCHGLPPLDEPLEDLPPMDAEALEGDKWTNWINSLNLTKKVDGEEVPIEVVDLYSEAKTGELLLKIMDKV
jgi:hypothetical protein